VNNAYPQKASAAWRIGAGRPAGWLDRQAIHTEMPCPITARIGVAKGDLINASPAALANNASELNVARSSRAFSLAAGSISLAPPGGCEPNRLCRTVPLSLGPPRWGVQWSCV